MLYEFIVICIFVEDVVIEYDVRIECFICLVFFFFFEFVLFVAFA